MSRIFSLLGLLIVTLALLSLSAPAAAQPRRSVDPRAQTARQMLKPITVNFTDARLEDIIVFLADFTGTTFDVMWLDAKHADGLDKDATVTLSVKEMPALSMLERTLKRAYDGFDGATWQFNDLGDLEIGPKSRLNNEAFLKVYDIRDLLFFIQNFDDVPNLGLGRIQQGQGGGSTTTFTVEDNDARGTDEEEAQNIIDLIVNFIESDQWRENGGDGGNITFFNGQLLVKAPDYIHRQLVGYSFWPTQASSRTRTRYQPKK